MVAGYVFVLLLFCATAAAADCACGFSCGGGDAGGHEDEMAKVEYVEWGHGWTEKDMAVALLDFCTSVRSAFARGHWAEPGFATMCLLCRQPTNRARMDLLDKFAIQLTIDGKSEEEGRIQGPGAFLPPPRAVHPNKLTYFPARRA